MDKVEAFSKLFEGDEMVTITLESTSKTFSVQKALLCNASAYFDKALNGGFKESKTKTLKLPGCDVKTFQWVLYWLCTQEFPYNKYEYDAMEANFYFELQEHVIRLWCFADTYLIRTLQNRAMHALLDMLNIGRMEPKTVNLALELAPEKSTLWNAIIDEVAFYCGKMQEYNSAEFEELGLSLPLCYEIMQLQIACSESTCDCRNGCTGTTGKDRDKYMVKI